MRDKVLAAWTKWTTKWHRRYWQPPTDDTNSNSGTSQPVVVITGGSAGIGQALAALAIGRGETVLLVARNGDRLRLSAEAMRGRGRVHWLALDVTASDAGAQIDAKLAESGGHCARLINAAGIGLAGDFSQQSIPKLEALIHLNVLALTRLCRHFLPAMLRRGDGGILNLASLGGYCPGPFQATYYASKAYVISLTEAMARECTGQGVQIAVASPGAVQTDFHRLMGGESGIYLRLLPVQSAETAARLIDRRFRLHQCVIIPGTFNTLMMLAVRVLPHAITTPIIACLLKPRRLGTP